MSYPHKCRVAAIASHFIQYHSCIWRELSRRPEIELVVYYLSDFGLRSGKDSGFGEVFSWDVDLTTGYKWELLPGAKNTLPGSLLHRWNPCPLTMPWFKRADVFLRSDTDSPGALLFLYSALLAGHFVLYRGDSTLLSQRPQTAHLKRIMLMPVFKRTVYALAVGHHAHNYALSLGVPERRIVESRHNVDSTYWTTIAAAYGPQRVELKQTLGVGQDAAVVLFSGKLTSNKRVADVIRGVGRLANSRPIVLLIAGSGEDRKALADLGHEYLNLNIRFLGFMKQQELPRAYAVSDVICLASSSETWGLVINEAMYFGCVPVVSDRVGCAPDLVSGVGEVFPVGDDQALSLCLAKVLDELPERKARVAQRLGNFSLERAVDGIVAAALQASSDRQKRRRQQC